MHGFKIWHENHTLGYVVLYRLINEKKYWFSVGWWHGIFFQSQIILLFMSLQ